MGNESMTNETMDDAMENETMTNESSS